MATFNRGKLARLIREGKVVCTKSYSFDDQYGGQRSVKTFPVRMINCGDEFTEGFINIYPSDLVTKSGGAYSSDGGKTVDLTVHSNLNYTFQILP